MAPTSGEYTVSFKPEATLTAEKFFSKDEGDKMKETLETLKKKFEEIKNPVMYIFVNKGLQMNPGKVMAQVAHAQEELFVEIMDSHDEKLKDFHLKCMKQNPRTVIILQTENSDELYKINSYLESCDIWTGIYVDEGSADGDYMLEPTALACQYLDKCDPRTETIFKMFKLYESSNGMEEFYRSRLDNISYIIKNYDYRPVLGNWKPRDVLRHIKYEIDLVNLSK